MKNKILNKRYEIQQQLGKNPGRKTLLGKDLETDKLVVVKLLKFDDEFNWQDLKLFEREAQILQKLSHPAIPKYLDYFEVDESDYKGFAFVQNYINAKSLEQHLESGRTFSETEVKQIAKALLEVLRNLHSRQPAVIHRDIKPSNILLGNRSGNHVGDVYLVDFGAVNNTVPKSGTMTIVGTYGYMAQEQFAGRAVPASDLYSLGATLIYLVTGSHPADLLDDEMVIQFEESVNLSRDFISWLKWMTKTTLKKRPSSAEVALKELENPMFVESKLVVNKPNGSKIKLRKDKDELEILIPPYGFSLGTLISCTFIIVWLNFVLNHPAGGIKLLFLIFGILSFGGLIFSSLFKCFGCSIIHINQDKIKLTYKIFGVQCRLKSVIQKSHISKLEVVGRTIDKNAKGNPEIPPRLIIWAGKSKYELGKIVGPITVNNSSIEKEYLTSPEIDWLAQEISDFLDLAISRD